MKRKKDSLRYAHYVLFLAALLLVLLPFFIRWGNGNVQLSGVESYYHMRLARQLVQGVWTDQSVVGGQKLFVGPFDVLLAGAYWLTGSWAFVVLPVLMSVLSVLLLWKLLVVLQLKRVTRLLIIGVYALSPAFIAQGSLTPQSFVVMLLLAGLVLLDSWWIVGWVCLLLAGVSGLGWMLGVIAVVVGFGLYKGLLKELVPLLVLCAVMIAAAVLVPQVGARGIEQLVSDFGGLFGMSIFALLLAVIGAVLSWRRENKQYSVAVLVVVLGVLTFFFTELVVVDNVLVCILGGRALVLLLQRSWQLSFIRDASLLVLFCGLLFSGVSHAVEIGQSAPNSEFFSELAKVNGVVLSAQKYGFWIEDAKKTAVVDPLSELLPTGQERLGDVAELFNETEGLRAKVLLNKYAIRAVVITSEMKQGLVWDRDEQGLAFLVENSEMFKLVGNASSVQVWQRK